MLGPMQDQPLLISGIPEHAPIWRPGQDMVRLAKEGGIHHPSFAKIAGRYTRAVQP